MTGARHSRFFFTMSAMLLGIVVVGFFRSFYLQNTFGFPALPVHLHLHGAVLTLWFVLALVQPILIRAMRPILHRRLGVLGCFVAAAVVVASVVTLVKRGAPTIDADPGAAAGNLASLIMFSACVIFGVTMRRRPQVHKRLMLLASISIVAPAIDRIGRIPVVQNSLAPLLGWMPMPVEVAFALSGLLLLVFSVVVFDLATCRRLNLGNWIGLASIFLIAPAVAAALTVSGAWETFVRLVM